MAFSPSSPDDGRTGGGWPESARREERARIARDLHDTVLQTILGTRMLAENALAADDAEQLRRAMVKVVHWLDRAMHEGRETLGMLRRGTPEPDALPARLRREIEDPLTAHLTPATLTVFGQPRVLAPDACREAAMIGAEALRNARSHARARAIMVEVKYGRALTVRVVDDGIGCAPGVARSGRDGHYGLSGMRERAARIGGSLKIESAAGGTCVTLVVPAHRAFEARTQGRPGRRMATL